jgi:bifunctional DNA-binding transcriptional regulator/antitoxin component of YhaV-PrlF toxin-antitoxin module
MSCYSVAVGADGEVTLPKEVLEHLGLEPGSKLAFEIAGQQRVILRKEQDSADERPCTTVLHGRPGMVEVSRDGLTPGPAMTARNDRHDAFPKDWADKKQTAWSINYVLKRLVKTSEDASEVTGACPAELRAIANYDLCEMTLARLTAIDTALILWDWDHSCR